MVKKEVIKITKLPTPLVPLSRAIRVGDLLFVAGTTPSLNPNTLQEYPDIQSQARSCLENIKTIVEEAGTSLDNIVSVTAYLTDSSFFGPFNEEYRKFFPKDQPTRATVQVALARPGILLELSSIAVISDK